MTPYRSFISFRLTFCTDIPIIIEKKEKKKVNYYKTTQVKISS